MAGIARTIRRNNNVAGLRSKLKDSEDKVFQLSQQLDMQKMISQQMNNISYAMQELLMEKTGMTEDEITAAVKKSFEKEEAKDIQEVIDSEVPADVIDTSVKESNMDMKDEIPSNRPVDEVFKEGIPPNGPILHNPPSVETVDKMTDKDKTESYQKLASRGDMSDKEIRAILYPKTREEPGLDKSPMDNDSKGTQPKPIKKKRKPKAPKE